jgi:SAM domain (Sterile alpha motif)
MASSPLSCSSSASFYPLRERLYVHPIEWTVEETVNWLRSKGFDDTVCEKFIEQETTGDALLNLNVTSLKTEIGVDAYGKRFRIASAIDDLRRVASVRFPSVKPTWSRFSSQAAQQRSGLKPLLLRSPSVVNLTSPSAQPNSGHLPKTPILSPCREPDPDVLAIVQKPTKSDAKTEAQGRISPSHSPRSGQGKTVVSVYFWWRGWDDCIDGL